MKVRELYKKQVGQQVVSEQLYKPYMMGQRCSNNVHRKTSVEYKSINTSLSTSCSLQIHNHIVQKEHSQHEQGRGYFVREQHIKRPTYENEIPVPVQWIKDQPRKEG